MKRLIIALLLILTCSIIFGRLFVKASYDIKDEPNRYRYYTSIQIQEGDSLWSIAGEYAATCGMNQEAYVKALKKMNGLYKDTIHAGQYLTIFYDSDEKK